MRTAILSFLFVLPISAGAMNYSDQDRESSNVDDRRSGARSLMGNDLALAEACARVQIQTREGHAPGYSKEEVEKAAIDSINATTTRIRDILKRLEGKPGAHYIAACQALSNDIGRVPTICKRCKSPSLKDACDALEAARTDAASKVSSLCTGR